MKSVIDQALRNVERVYAFAGLSLVSENHLVHRRAIERLFVVAGETFRDVTRVEHGCFSRFTQAIVAVRQRVSERPQHHAVVSKERFHASDRFCLVVIETICVVVFNDARHGQKRFQIFRAATWTTTWSTTAVWS